MAKYKVQGIRDRTSGDEYEFIPPLPTDSDRGGVVASVRDAGYTIEVKVDPSTGKLYVPVLGHTISDVIIEDAPGGGVSISSGGVTRILATEQSLSSKVSKSGDTMEGLLNMGNNQLQLGPSVAIEERELDTIELSSSNGGTVLIRNVRSPVEDNDAVNKAYVDLHAGGIADVQILGVSQVEESVAHIPVASEDTLGVVMPDSLSGIGIGADGRLYVSCATAAHIKAGINFVLPICSALAGDGAFWGLARAAGIDTRASTSIVGFYSNEEQIAIQRMLGIRDSREVTF